MHYTNLAEFVYPYICAYLLTMQHSCLLSLIQLHFQTRCPGADPGINYEGQVGVHKSMNIITKGEGGAREYSTM